MRPSLRLLSSLLLTPIVSANYNTLITRFSADPSPFVVGDRLYVTSTHDEVNMTSFSMHDYNVFSTDDWTIIKTIQRMVLFLHIHI